jgi:hypothetical protein
VDLKWDSDQEEALQQKQDEVQVDLLYAMPRRPRDVRGYQWWEKMPHAVWKLHMAK